MVDWLIVVVVVVVVVGTVFLFASITNYAEIKQEAYVACLDEVEPYVDKPDVFDRMVELCDREHEKYEGRG